MAWGLTGMYTALRNRSLPSPMSKVLQRHVAEQGSPYLFLETSDADSQCLDSSQVGRMP